MLGREELRLGYIVAGEQGATSVVKRCGGEDVRCLTAAYGSMTAAANCWFNPVWTTTGRDGGTAAP